MQFENEAKEDNTPNSGTVKKLVSKFSDVSEIKDEGK